MKRLALLLVGVLAACQAPSGVSVQEVPFVVAAVGDIACPATARVRPLGCQQDAVAASVADADWIVALGDLQYPGGPGTSWAGYDAAWGTLADKTLPVVGNHEWLTPGAQGFYDYWATRYPQSRGAWYRSLGNGWTFVGADVNCGKLDCAAELTVFNALLDAAGPCVIVGWHQPRWSSGDHGSSVNKKLDRFWQSAVAHGVPLVLNGHEHSYERTIPFTLTTEVIVGTGGKSQDLPTPPAAFTAVQIDNTFGHLRLSLLPGSYTAQYIDLSGTVRDSFDGACLQ